MNPWLTDQGKQPMPVQPVVKIEVTPEQIEQALSIRAALAVGSEAGPSTLGKALGCLGGGCERWVEAGGGRYHSKALHGGGSQLLEADRRLWSSGTLSAAHLLNRPRRRRRRRRYAPSAALSLSSCIRSLRPNEDCSLLTTHIASNSCCARVLFVGAEIDETTYGSRVYDIRMQDMASAMTEPCA